LERDLPGRVDGDGIFPASVNNGSAEPIEGECVLDNGDRPMADAYKDQGVAAMRTRDRIGQACGTAVNDFGVCDGLL
jgi:hypothetical protein